MINIGKLIEIKMAEKGLTQQQLANILGIKQQMISQWITGKSNPKTRTLNKIAKALNCSLKYFLNDNSQNSDLATNNIVIGNKNNTTAIKSEEFDTIKNEIKIYKKQLLLKEEKIENLKEKNIILNEKLSVLEEKNKFLIEQLNFYKNRK